MELTFRVRKVPGGKTLQVFFVVNLLFLSSCTKPELSSSNKTEKLLRIGVVGKCAGVEPLLETKEACSSISKLLFSTLTQTIATSTGVETSPQLAESWTFENPTKIKIQLRKDIRWSNGAPLHASHFLTRWKRILSNPNLPHVAALLFPVKNARDFYRHRTSFAEVGIKATDPITLVIELETSDPNFPSQLSHVALSPEYTLSPPEAPAYLGPYTLKTYNGNSGLTLVPNAFYPHKHTPFKQIVVFFQSNSKEALEQLKDGALDFLTDEKQPSNSDGNLASWKQVFSSPVSIYLLLNPKHRFFSLRKARRAFFSAVQRHEILDLMHWEHKTKESLFVPRTDIVAAQNLLQEISVKADSASLTLSYPGFEEARELAENIRAQWAKNLNVYFELTPSEIDSAASIIIARSSSGGGANDLRYLWEQHLAKNLTNTSEYIPYEAALMPWTGSSPKSIEAFEEWITAKESFLLPLVTLTKVVYLNPIFKGLSQDIFHLWNFLNIEPATGD